MSSIRPNEAIAYWKVDDRTGAISEFHIDRHGEATKPGGEHSRVVEADKNGDFPTSFGKGNAFALYVDLEADHGFVSPAIHRKVLNEFAKIDGQEWTSDIASGMFQTGE